jgi:CDP-glucose 4,6-dehydratase
MITRAYADTYGVAAAVLRSENLYGGGDFNWNRIVPSTIQSILQGRTPVIRGDGKVRRDYLYVEDAVAAYLAIGAKLKDATVQGKLFRISTGTSVSVLEMVKEIMRAAGLHSQAPEVLGQASDSRVDMPYQPDFERATLGWQSRYSLAEGLARTWAWYQGHFKTGKN